MFGFSAVNAPAHAGAPGQKASAALPAIANPLDSRALMTGLSARGSSTAIWARGLVFAALYFVAMVACIALTRFGAHVAPVWIASAILAWLLLSSATREWPIHLGLTALAHALGGIVVGDQLAIEVFYLIANLASPLLLAGAMRWSDDKLEFEDRGEVLRFLLLGGVLAPGVSTAIAALGMEVSGAGFDQKFASIWFLADGLSFIVFLPLFKLTAGNGWRELLEADKRWRVLALFTVLAAAHALAAFYLPASGYRIFLLILIPYMIYVAFDIGLTGARAVLALSAVLLLTFALFAPAPLDRPFAPQEYLLTMQFYVAVTVVSVLPLAATLAERQRLYETVSEALSDAQAAWGALIAAEAHSQLIADNTSDLILRMDGRGVILFASPACRALRYGPDDLVGKELFALTQADDAARVRNEIDAMTQARIFDRPCTLQLHLQNLNDDWCRFELRATLIAAEPAEFVAVLRQVQ